MWRTIIVALALICLGLLGYYAVSKRAVQISAKLAATSNAAVAAKVGGVRVEVTQRDARLVGTVPSDALKSEAERVVRGVSGVKAVKNELVVEAPRPEEPKGPEAPLPHIETPPTPTPPAPAPSEATPLDLKVAWDGASVTASGNVPGALKKEIDMIFMTDFPDAQVKSTVATTTGTVTAEQVQAFKAAVKALARTLKGSVTVDANDFELSGSVASADEEAALKKLVSDEVKGLASTVTLTPNAPAVAEEEPDAGVADAADVAAAEDAAGAPGAAVPAAGELTGAQCQEAIAQALEGDKRITFKPGSGRLSDDGDAKVQLVWGLLQRCPTTKGLIAAYSDDLGEPDHVKQLTQARAYNVHKRLTELGMPKDRLKYAGMGQRDFKYPNRGETRVLNQRIEFKLEVQ
ncbi:MAG: OmpA family protein [Myxococcota bacterium]